MMLPKYLRYLFLTLMKQKNQIRLLFISCGIVLIGLISIQYYLIRNTYQLISDTYLSEIKKEIDPIWASPEMDTIESRVVDEVRMLSYKKIKDEFSTEEFREELEKIADTGRRLSQEYVKSQLIDYPDLEEIRIRTRVDQIIFETKNTSDTLLKLTDKPITFLGEDFNGKSIIIDRGIVHSHIEQEKDSLQEAIDYNYKYNQRTEIDISNFQGKIWKKMLWILIGALLLILSVITLFFWMYRTLIKQKKIAEIKTDFANNISHELKTPVSSLSLIIKSLQIEEIKKNPEKLNELISSLERQTNRIQNLTEKVLESAMEYKTEFKEQDVVPFLKGIVSSFKSDTHTIEWEIEPESLILSTDFHLLERVIENLLENGKKYNQNGSYIKLKSYLSGPEYVIEIEDNGIGITPKEQQKIFEKFYRVSEGDRHNIKGVGLGLYLSQEMMKSLNGSISVKSKIGEGSTFILRIPIV
ncbi:HAMP domain-containing histidine kinase [Aequorivita sp. H23M31]|uniref:histidine kinase n=2 Tax=Aequorivita ciconiae TaxID=2494375 RepID=A0A410G3Z6_9FLAO|nr:HAMP domain-containing histidine kinase [Aequorivita sp. H23M31]